MHEMSIAMSIVDIAVDEMKSQGAKRVLKVKVVIGGLSGVVAESVEFCYEACAKGTPAQGSELILERVAPKAQCMECEKAYEPSGVLSVCPECGAFGGKIISGEELYVDEILAE